MAALVDDVANAFVDSGKAWERAPSRSYRVLPITLATGEALPTLVRSLDWVPARVPTRWAVRSRRFESMDNTLASDLRGVADLYDWGEKKARLDLDEMLERSQLPTGPQLESLIGFLRQKNTSKALHFNSLPTVAAKAISIRCFLQWTADPTSQGNRRRKSNSQILEERAMLAALFRPLEHYRSSSERIRPLQPDEVNRIHALFGPVRNAEGRIVQPLRFQDSNPFRQMTRLRNWLMVIFSLLIGHRRGELLKTRTDDLPRSTDEGLKIRRRPHDRTDARRYRPSVKTVERILPMPSEAHVGLRGYLTWPAPLGLGGQSKAAT